MLGLPTETDDDVEAIAILVLKCKSVLERQQRATRITLSVAPFVPKAGTPFERLPMEERAVLEHRISMLRKRLRPNGIKVTGDSPAWSEVQAILARGDTNLAAVLTNVKQTTLADWNRAVRDAGVDTGALAHRRWGADQALPWQTIDSGLTKNYLRSEMERALSEATQVNHGKSAE
jgi:radical SAM superfamily enzyme YgiQ (UPF0313 family)